MTHPDPDMEKVHQLVSKLEHWWWSPQPPENHISRVDKEHASKGLFNLFWVLSGCQKGAILPTAFNMATMSRLKELMPQIIDGYPVYEWATVLTPKQFYDKIVKPWKSPVFVKIGDYEFWRKQFSVAG